MYYNPDDLKKIIEQPKSFKIETSKKCLIIKSTYDIETELAILYGANSIKKRKDISGFIYEVEKKHLVPP